LIRTAAPAAGKVFYRFLRFLLRGRLFLDPDDDRLVSPRYLGPSVFEFDRRHGESKAEEGKNRRVDGRISAHVGGHDGVSDERPGHQGYDGKDIEQKGQPEDLAGFKRYHHRIARFGVDGICHFYLDLFFSACAVADVAF
jgi:hypothetical protein